MVKWKSDLLEAWSLRKQPTFGDATTGFPAKWRLRKERRNSIMMTPHFPELGGASDWLNHISYAVRPIRSTTQIWVVTCHQYGISALVSLTSFGGKTSGSVAKCRLFSQATWSSTKTVIWEYYGIFSQRPIKPRMANPGDGPVGPQSSTHIIFNPNWSPKAKKNYFRGRAHHLILGSGWLPLPPRPTHLKRERFSNHDGNSNENVTKAIGLTVHLQQPFLYISLPSLYDHDVKLTSSDVLLRT